MFNVNCGELRKASGTLLLPPPGYVGRYLGPGRWREYVSSFKENQGKRKRPPAVPTEPPRGRGIVLGPASEALFVHASYDGSSVLTLTATNGHLTAVAKVSVKATGAGRPWARWIPWWRWVWTLAGFESASADVRPTDASGVELSSDRLRIPIPGPAAGLSPGEASEMPWPPANVLSTGVADRRALSRVVHLFAKAAWPAPRHRTELALERDGSAGVTVGTVTWTAASALRLPFVFSPANPSLRLTRRWLHLLGGAPNPEGRVTVERVTDVHDRTFYRLGSSTGRHALWVPEGRAVDRNALHQLARLPLGESGTEIKLPVELVRPVAVGTLRRSGNGAQVAVEFRPDPQRGRGELRVRGLDNPGIENGAETDALATETSPVGWSVALRALHLLSALAPLRGEVVAARPLGKGRRLVLAEIPGVVDATTAVVRCRPAPPDPIALAVRESAGARAQQE